MRRFNSQTLILIGATVFVLYLAGVPLLMLLYGSIRSAPIGEPGARTSRSWGQRPVRRRPHGGRTWIVGGPDAPARPDPVLIRALRAAHAMLGQDAVVSR